jgi:ABC-type ATPase with predicted acetyltransferase domain
VSRQKKRKPQRQGKRPALVRRVSARDLQRAVLRRMFLAEDYMWASGEPCVAIVKCDNCGLVQAAVPSTGCVRCQPFSPEDLGIGKGLPWFGGMG